mmetsp:Transcript_27827/g.58477  ORF Transcript_27827/g.58477 Transcript_27827/m.58477 type:complete len:558 (-) Transcript_27827:99-1772(-)
MARIKTEDVAPGLTDVWRLWRHCLCRFGWYPLFVAPLVTCACFLDLYSSTGCDFIRLDIGFTPINEIWPEPNAKLGLFSFESSEIDRNRWKRSFNKGCRSYTANFEEFFIAADQTWQISRIMAYISGCSGLVAVATSWLLTITPLPASFFWPGLLLPACILSMLTGSAKFLFFDTQICIEKIWFAEETETPVAPESCALGESAVYAIAAVSAYFMCTILVCSRSPTKRKLDENFGKRRDETAGGTVDSLMDIARNEPGRDTHTNTEILTTNLGIQKKHVAIENGMDTSSVQKIVAYTKEQRLLNDQSHVRAPSELTWSTGAPIGLSFDEKSKSLPVMSPPTETSTENNRTGAYMEWGAYGQPIVLTVNESAMSQSDGSSQDSRISPLPSSARWSTPTPPRNGRKRTSANTRYAAQSREGGDAASVSSRISKISFAETRVSEDSSHEKQTISGRNSVSSSIRSTPSVVAIPRRNHYITSSPLRSIGSLHSSPIIQRTKYARREDRNDIFLGSHKIDSKRDKVELLPPLEETTSPRSQDDHGDLINKCVQDLKRSFGTL